MTVYISFSTAKFDPTSERRNPLNPIAGESVLLWLKSDRLGAQYSCEGPFPENWGWSMNVSGPDTNYQVGAIAFDETCDESGGTIEWQVQISKRKSLTEMIIGAGAVDQFDPLVVQVFGVLSSDDAISEVGWA